MYDWKSTLRMPSNKTKFKYMNVDRRARMNDDNDSFVLPSWASFLLFRSSILYFQVGDEDYLCSSFSSVDKWHSVIECISFLLSLPLTFNLSERTTVKLISKYFLCRCVRSLRNPNDRTTAGKVSMRLGRILQESIPKSTDSIRQIASQVTFLENSFIGGNWTALLRQTGWENSHWNVNQRYANVGKCLSMAELERTDNIFLFIDFSSGTLD